MGRDCGGAGLSGSATRTGGQVDAMKTCALLSMPLVCALVISTNAQENPSPRLPRFEDYPVAEIWRGTPTPPKLTSRSERLYRTRLTDAAKELPNFAGHYRFATWGCGSECISGAIIDLQSGDVYSPPSPGDTAHFSVCESAYEDSGVDFRLDSRLILLRCGLNYSERLGKNVPDAYYFVWDGNSFKAVHHTGSRKVHRLDSSGSAK